MLPPHDRTPTSPTGFLSAPSYGSSGRPGPVPAPEWQPGLTAPLSLRAVPTLTVRPNGDVTLTKPLMQAVPHLRAGGPVDIVPPGQHGRGGTWHLDTRATAVRRLPAAGVMRFRAAAPSRTHFIIPAVAATPGQFGGAHGTAGTRELLLFRLGPEVDGHPGYFELLPVR